MTVSGWEMLMRDYGVNSGEEAIMVHCLTCIILHHPASWYNNDKGGFRIDKGPDEAKAVVYSGEREMKTGEKIEFEWSMLITPVKKINYRSQFTDRYYHNGENPMPSDADLPAVSE